VRSQAGSAGDHDQQLLLSRVPVKRANRVSGVELIEARTEVLAAGLAPKAGAAVREPRLLFVIVEGGLEEVRRAHCPSPGSSPSQ
jgi:hypothetical protein